MLIAVDIGGTKLAAALIDNSRIIESRKMVTPKSGTAEALASALAELIKPLVSQADAVAVASTGIITHGRLTAVNPANLGGLNDFPLQKTVAEITGLPVRLLNDAQAAAWGEYCQLHEKPRNMAFVTVSTGVGAGLVIDGRLQIGLRGLAGHAGHMTIDPQGDVCGCGQIGCVEGVASGTAIGRLARQTYGADADAITVFERFRAGEPEAQSIVDRSAQAVVQMLCNLKALLDIDVAVVGGSVGLAAGYIERIDYFMQQKPTLFRVKVMPAQLGHDAGLIGAALWASLEF